MKPNFNQISLEDTYSDLELTFESDKPALLKLFRDYIDISELIPKSFFDNYYKDTGHPRDFSLESFICAFIIKRILAIPSTKLLITILSLSKELRRLCGFFRMPHPAQFCRFKNLFINDIEDLFNHLVDLTEPICKNINPQLSSIVISDTTGIESYVKENNPKFFNSLLSNFNKLSKTNPEFDAYKYTCSKMPKQSSVNKDIKLAYINGHFCYSYKANIITNGLGVIRYIDFFDNKNNCDSVESKSPAEQKDEYDAKSLIPTLNTFFQLHPSFKYKYFLGDAGFDAIDNYKYLYKDHSIIPIIPFRKPPANPIVNENGVPVCPNDHSLPMHFDGITREKGRPDRIKWLCPKSKKVTVGGKTQYILSCNNPCSSSKCGKVTQIAIDSDFRINTAVPRGSEEWTNLYKKRTIIERTISMLKISMSVDNMKIRDKNSTKAEIYFCAIAQQILVLLAEKLGIHNGFLKIKSIIA